VYLRSLTISHMKRLEKLHLDFTEADGSHRMWTVLIGENGTAKTTILQAVAMAAAGRLRVNELAGSAIPSLLPHRKRDPAMEIEARFSFSALGSKSWFHPQEAADLPPGTALVSRVNLDAAETTLTGFDGYQKPGDVAPAQPQGLTPLDRARAKNTAHWFVAGYGVHRHFPYETGASPDLFRASVERLRPLFDHQAALTGIGFIDIFGPRTKRGKMFISVLTSVLVNTGLLPDDIEGLELKGRSAKRHADLPLRSTFTQRVGARLIKLPLTGVAHGMQSTLAWVSDLVGHILFEAEENVLAEDMEGCVLIDEIDLYLHPTWQVRIVHALRATFPRVQFIVTTHSPALLSACRPHEIVHLGIHPVTGAVTRLAPDPETREPAPVEAGGDPALQPDPQTLTGTEIYDTYFSMTNGPLNPEGALRRELAALRGIPWRTPTQDRRLADLEAKFAVEGPRVDPDAPVPVDTADEAGP
jgi:hypothetical protein